LNCVDLPGEIDVTIEPFDGRNWSKNIERLVNNPAADKGAD
jgi:hypothetical protein